jgi:hypothetical protein
MSELKALGAWYREMAAGQRSASTFDPLWRAACLETEAQEWESMGLASIGAKCRQEARVIIALAAREQAA